MNIEFRTHDDKTKLYRKWFLFPVVPRVGDGVQIPPRGSGNVTAVTYNYRINTIFVWVELLNIGGSNPCVQRMRGGRRVFFGQVMPPATGNASRWKDSYMKCQYPDCYYGRIPILVGDGDVDFTRCPCCEGVWSNCQKCLPTRRAGDEEDSPASESLSTPEVSSVEQALS